MPAAMLAVLQSCLQLLAAKTRTQVLALFAMHDMPAPVPCVPAAPLHCCHPPWIPPRPLLATWSGPDLM
jgi:hypothetical protein